MKEKNSFAESLSLSKNQDLIFSLSVTYHKF